MSENFSTKRLIEAIGAGMLRHAEEDAIIARLRAADRLCGAAKKMLNGYRDAPYGLARDLHKAIAEYEGKEKRGREGIDMSIFLRDQIMRVMQGHRGRANAMPRKALLAELRLYRPSFTDRDCRELYAGLPICSCEDGLFLPQTVAEVQEFKAYITKAWGPIQAHRRCATIISFYPKLAPPANQLDLPL